MNLIFGFEPYKKPATLEEVQKHVGPGWSSLLADLISDLDKLGWDGRIIQVKEKFGGLRFYTGGQNSSESQKRIREAEELSYKVCEMCGKPGTPGGVGWVKTMCPEHQAEREVKGRLWE